MDVSSGRIPRRGIFVVGASSFARLDRLRLCLALVR